MDEKQLGTLVDKLTDLAIQELSKHLPDKPMVILQGPIPFGNVNEKKKTTPSGEGLRVVEMAVGLARDLISLETARIQSGAVRPC